MPPRVHRAAAQPPAQPRPLAPKPLAKPPKGWGKLWDYGQYPLFSIVALAAAASATIGQWLVAAYAVYAVLIRRQSSSLTFGLALIILVAIPVFQLLGQSGIAENAAIYVYELLVIGTIQAIIELKLADKDGGEIYGRH